MSVRAASKVCLVFRKVLLKRDFLDLSELLVLASIIF